SPRFLFFPLPLTLLLVLLLLLIDLIRLCEASNPVTRQSEHGPFVHWFGAKRSIKFDGWFVPIEHSPFHPAAVPLAGDFRKLDEQCTSVAFAAIFQIGIAHV